MRHLEGNSELLARIDERTMAIEKLLSDHLIRYEKRNFFLNKALLFLLVLNLILNLDKAPIFFSVVGKAFGAN